MVIEFERNRLRQQEIEVRALVALTTQEVSVQAKMRAVYKLIEIAFPEDVIEKIEEQDKKQTRLL